MFEITEGFKNLINLLTIDNRKELVSYCKSLDIEKSDFATLLVAGSAGILDPYKYAVHFMDVVPKHLEPKRGDLSYISENGVGPMSEKGRKVARKVFQIFKDRRLFAAHLFYTPCYTHWHLFYFDQRDQEQRGNHWIKGPHIHYVNDILNNNELGVVWDKVIKGDVGFNMKIHIRYIDSRNRHKSE